MAWYNAGIRSRLRKAHPKHVIDAVRLASGADDILVDWVNRGPVRENWGDAIAPVLVQWLSGRQALNRRDVLNLGGQPVYSTIGSMLGTVNAAGWEVWGSGFVHPTSSTRVRPRQIHAVRGPLSRARLIKLGLDCPEIFGDPALFFPRFYRPEVQKRYRLGIIPHFKEYQMPIFARFKKMSDVNVINIRSGLLTVPDDINQCECIVSGSLHGLVAGDAYGIPSMWLKVSGRPYGGGFKFRDYLASVGRTQREPLALGDNTTVEDLFAQFEDYRIDIDLESFLESCPFLEKIGLESRAASGSTRVAELEFNGARRPTGRLFGGPN